MSKPKLTIEQVEEIRLLTTHWLDGKIMSKDVATHYGVSAEAIRKIWNKKSWPKVNSQVDSR